MSAFRSPLFLLGLSSAPAEPAPAPYRTTLTVVSSRRDLSVVSARRTLDVVQ